MAALKHDADGFLVGKPIKTTDEAVQLLGGIKSDTGRILAAIHAMPRRTDTRPVSRTDQRQPLQTVGTRQAASNDASAAPRRAANQPRDALGRFVSQRATVPATRAQAREGNTATETARAATQAAQAAQSAARTAVATRRDQKVTEAARDAKGRFQKGDGTAAGGSKPGIAGAVGAGIGRAAGAIAGADQVDPAIAAANEIKGMVSTAANVIAPVGRGVGKLFGRGATSPELKEERAQTGLLKRMAKSLQRQEQGAGGGQGGSMLGMLMSVLGPLLTLGGLLPKLLGAGGGLAGGALGTAGKLGGGLLKGAGGLLKRVPILAGALAGFEGLMADREIANDPNLSPEERRSKRIANGTKTAGALAGTAAGAVIGTAIFPGVGTAIGAVVGGWLGGEGGQMLAKPFEGVLTWFQGLDLKTSWDSAISGLKGWVSSLPGAGLVSAGISKVKEFAAPVVSAAKEKLAPAVAAVKEKAAPVVESIKQSAPVQGAKRLGGAIVEGAGAVKDWVLGKTSSKYESGSRGAAAVSTGKGDAGGASYGTYQLASKTGTLQKFLKDSPYGKQFEGLTPGTEAFNAKWKEVAASDAGFGKAQHDFIEKTHYAPQMEKLAQAGIDLSGRGAAVKDAIWSTSVQFGGKSDLVQKALAGKDVKSMSDADITAAIQDYKIANNDTLFKSSSADVRAGTLVRAKKEKADLQALAAQPAATAAGGVPLTQPTTAATAVAPATVAVQPAVAVTAARMTPPPPMPAPVSVQPPAPVPQVTQINSAPQTVQVAQAPQMPGQDVSERGIAHIVTGGIATATLR